MMVAAGYNVSTPIVFICDHYSWVMGRVKDLYLFWESSGDQHVRRCADVLNQLEQKFAIDTPYFDLF